MIRRFVFAICLLLAALLLVQLPNAVQAADSWQDRVDEVVKPLIEKETVFGTVVGILASDGKREFFCYGKTKAEGPQPTPETLFEIGSVSKTFTTLLLALMVEKGEVKLDDPVRLLLPKEWTLPKRGEREITPLELATHSSGLPENPPNLIRALIKDDSVQLDPFARFDHKQLAECLAEIKLKDVDRPPVAYSNLGMGLLGEALMLKTGKSYDQLIRSQIAQPLNMNDTVVIPSEDQDKRTATGHGEKGKELPCWTFASLAGAGAIRSTATDMLSYMEAQSGRTETPLAAAMKASQEKRQSAFVIMSVGLGWFIRDYSEHQVWWHNGGTNGFTTFVAFCRKPAVAVVVLCNTGPDGLGRGDREHITEEEFLKDFDAKRSPSEQRVARHLMAWAKAKDLRDNFRRGTTGVAFIPAVENGACVYYPMSLRGKGWVSIQLRWLKDRPPFSDKQKREQLFQRFKDIPGLVATEAAVDGFPKFPITSLTEQQALDRFISTLDWIVEEIRRVPPSL